MTPAPLQVNRSLLKLVLLNLVTFGVYGIVFFSGISRDINIIANRYDGKKTMHYCMLRFLVGPFTLGIGALVWNHRLCSRIDDELRRRGIAYRFGAGSFWGWNILGVVTLAGPFIYRYKLLKAMNQLCADYNARG